MGMQDVLDVKQAAPAGVTAADASFEEIITRLVASQTGTVTITAGDILAVDTTSYGGSVRSNVVLQAHTTTGPNAIGVALDTTVIPATTAAGDRFVAIRILRRGFHPAVNVTTAATIGHSVAISATAGRGTSVATASATAAQISHGLIGTVLGAGATNLVPVLVNVYKG